MKKTSNTKKRAFNLQMIGSNFLRRRVNPIATAGPKSAYAKKGERFPRAKLINPCRAAQRRAQKSTTAWQSLARVLVREVAINQETESHQQTIIPLTRSRHGEPSIDCRHQPKHKERQFALNELRH